MLITGMDMRTRLPSAAITSSTRPLHGARTLTICSRFFVNDSAALLDSLIWSCLDIASCSKRLLISISWAASCFCWFKASWSSLSTCCIPCCVSIRACFVISPLSSTFVWPASFSWSHFFRSFNIRMVPFRFSVFFAKTSFCNLLFFSAKLKACLFWASSSAVLSLLSSISFASSGWAIVAMMSPFLTIWSGRTYSFAMEPVLWLATFTTLPEASSTPLPFTLVGILPKNDHTSAAAMRTTRLMRAIHPLASVTDTRLSS